MPQLSTSTNYSNCSPLKKEKVEDVCLFSDTVYSEIISYVVAKIFIDVGCASIEKKAHDVITRITTNFLNQMCETAQRVSEHSGRTEITLLDVQLSLDKMCMPLADFFTMLDNLRYNPNSQPINLGVAKLNEQPTVLKVGDPRPHPSNMPNFLPSFPDPHTYIRTTVSGEIESSYEKVRNISAKNKRNIENSLITFALATQPSITVFQEYEKALRIEAKDVLERAKQLKKGKIEARQMAKNTQRLNKELESAPNLDILMDDLLQEETSDKKINVVDDFEDDSSIIDEIEQEEVFELKDTEKSYIRQRIPIDCQILLPFNEETPYVSALVTDENLDDDKSHFTKLLNSEIEKDLTSESIDDFENPSQKNYLDI